MHGKRSRTAQSPEKSNSLAFLGLMIWPKTRLADFGSIPAFLDLLPQSCACVCCALVSLVRLRVLFTCSVIALSRVAMTSTLNLSTDLLCIHTVYTLRMY